MVRVYEKIVLLTTINKSVKSPKDNVKVGKDCIGIGCGAIILNDKTEVLLIRRKNLGEDRTTPNMWSVPGGEVNFGEKVEEAVIREVKEEVGVDIEIIRHIGHYDQILKKSKVHWHCDSFLCRIKKGTPEIMEKDKFDRLEWAPINDIPKDSGIAHVVVPLYKLGLICKEDYGNRLRETPES